MDWKTRPRCDETAAWPLLQAHARHFLKGAEPFDLRTAFVADEQRFERFSQQAPYVFADLSKNLIDARAQELLLQLARECGFEDHRQALLTGEEVNTAEQRAAWHTLLREPYSPGREDASQGLREEVATSLADMLAFAEAVRADASITDVVNIGIGGSDLGPRMAAQTLRAAGVTSGPRVHFVANGDGHEISELLPALDAAHTLFIVVSKTFGTAETLLNAKAARQWFLAQGGTDVARHFVGVTCNVEAASQFGISRVFSIWDWVGGRYSLWSAVGLPLAIAIGSEGFRALLAGASAMDQHFASAPIETNLPLRLALLDVWQCDFLGLRSRCVAPYHHGLRRLPAYLQQLEMESNGKGVDASGRALSFSTSPVVWGEAGSNGQHAFFQMLHQGPEVIPVEFIAVREPAHSLQDQHRSLLANALAQARALMIGQTSACGHRNFPGNRPSTFLLLERMDPTTLGALLALYEHRVFSSGSLWGINSFDQWGVELGKTIAADLAPRLASGDAAGLDASTAGLLARLRPS
ncbi:glucose-6-phosphate isomerase [Ottowia thiooxydans]|uniref:glucose-6-phosphate isomerase n=1 Tax=Ottowia thiooxydans TaxID=219182 RepID=UPI00040D002B|nr:glucose-6-phosphate isomerase [Ottowia thiooxydans]